MTDMTTSGCAQAAVLHKVQDDVRGIGQQRPSRSRYDILTAIRQGLHSRAQRGRYFSQRLFSDPAWDMLLELYAASLAQRRLSVSRLSQRACVPMTTTLRWIAALEKEGAIERQPDPLDGRRVFIMLSEKGRERMAAYFDELPAETILL